MLPASEGRGERVAKRLPRSLTVSSAGGAQIVRKVVVVILTSSRPHWILLLRRGPSKRSFWQPVTGRVDAGERLDHAARREVEEETGIRYGRWRDLRWSHRFRTREATFVEHGFALSIPQQLIPRLSEEHVAWRWVSAQGAENLLRWKENRDVLRLGLLRLAEGRGPRIPG